MKVVDIERVIILMRFIQFGWTEERKKAFDEDLRMMLETQCEDLADHDKRIRDDVVSEMLKRVEFEEKWLSDAWKENGYNYSSKDVDIAFSGIKHKLRQLKGEQNEI